MQTRQKITVGEITPAILQSHDLLFIDYERNVWQLVLLLGFDKRFLLGKRIFARWLLFHPNGGFIVRHIALNVPIYLDALTEERNVS